MAGMPSKRYCTRRHRLTIEERNHAMEIESIFELSSVSMSPEFGYLNECFGTCKFLLSARSGPLYTMGNCVPRSPGNACNNLDLETSFQLKYSVSCKVNMLDGRQVQAYVSRS